MCSEAKQREHILETKCYKQKLESSSLHKRHYDKRGNSGLLPEGSIQKPQPKTSLYGFEIGPENLAESKNPHEVQMSNYQLSNHVITSSSTQIAQKMHRAESKQAHDNHQ